MKDLQVHQVPQWLNSEFLVKGLQPILKEAKVLKS